MSATTKRPKEADTVERMLWKKAVEVANRVVLGQDGLRQIRGLTGAAMQDKVEKMMCEGGATGWLQGRSTVYQDKGVIRIIDLTFHRHTDIAHEIRTIRVKRHRDGRVTEYAPIERSERP